VANDSGSTFDVVILGGGNAGYAAAFRAVKLGMSVAMVERDKVGGTCLHRGCIPTKALLHAADLVDEIRDAGDFGILVQEPQVDWGKVLSFKDNVVGRMYQGLAGLVKKKKIELLECDGRLVDAKTVSVQTPDGERRVSAERGVILATGAFPRDLPFIEADGDKVHNSNHGLEASDVPKSVIIVGGNYIGLEFASVYRSFGAEVTVVEMLPKIAPLEDDDISDALLKLLQRRGMKFHLGVSVSGAKPNGSGVEVQIEKDGSTETLTADRMFVAIGRAPRTEGIGLEDVGISTDRGYIVTDANFRTSVEGVYAIGDVTGKMMLAHAAEAMGIVAAETIAGAETMEIDFDMIPRATYCQPQIGSFGYSEAQAKEKGYDVKTATFPFTANGKAMGLGDAVGFVKVVADATHNEILGAHMIGPDVTELLPVLTLAQKWDLTADEVARNVFAHPTLSEAVKEAVEGIAGHMINL